MRLSLFSSKQCIIKQLLDSVFVISGIIKVLVSVISLSLRLQLVTLTSTLIIPDITKTSSNNCLLFALLSLPSHNIYRSWNIHRPWISAHNQWGVLSVTFYYCFENHKYTAEYSSKFFYAMSLLSFQCTASSVEILDPGHWENIGPFSLLFELCEVIDLHRHQHCINLCLCFLYCRFVFLEVWKQKNLCCEGHYTCSFKEISQVKGKSKLLFMLWHFWWQWWRLHSLED